MWFIQANVWSLKSLGLPTKSYGSLLSSVLLNKLSQKLRFIISRNTISDDWNLDTLMRELEQEVEARQKGVSAATGNGAPGWRPPREPHTATTLTVSNHLCGFCQGTHPSDSCEVVTLVDMQQQVLRKLGQCFICHCKRYINKDCCLSWRCSGCGSKHHSSTCSREINSHWVSQQMWHIH